MEQRYDVADEAAFLQQQAADAKVAMQRTLAAMQETAKSVADVSAWTRMYPWYAVGAAAVAGFITATAVLSPPQRQRHGAHTETASASGSSLWSSVLSLLWGMGRGVLMSTIASAVGITVGEAAADNEASVSEPVSVAR
jgi:hypothetical protein